MTVHFSIDVSALSATYSKLVVIVTYLRSYIFQILDSHHIILYSIVLGLRSRDEDALCKQLATARIEYEELVLSQWQVGRVDEMPASVLLVGRVPRPLRPAVARHAAAGGLRAAAHRLARHHVSLRRLRRFHLPYNTGLLILIQRRYVVLVTERRIHHDHVDVVVVICKVRHQVLPAAELLLQEVVDVLIILAG